LIIRISEPFPLLIPKNQDNIMATRNLINPKVHRHSLTIIKTLAIEEPNKNFVKKVINLNNLIELILSGFITFHKKF